MGGQHSSGKGDKYRHVDYKKWSANWDEIFGKKKETPKAKHTKRKKSNATK